MNESINDKDERRMERLERRGERHRIDGQGHVWTGIFILAIGALALARSMDVPMPVWLFTWQMLLIAIGLFIGFRKGFRDGGWFIPIIIGGFFLANEFFLEGQLGRHIWPMILILVGAFFIFRPRSKKCLPTNQPISATPSETTSPVAGASYTQDDIIDSVNVFSGSKKVILSKNFRGGEIVNVFGGCEVDLTQADIANSAELEVTSIFGGATLIVPSNWAVRTDSTVTIFGGIGDKRRIMPSPDTPAKTLVLRGTMIFGGMEIKSY